MMNRSLTAIGSALFLLSIIPATAQHPPLPAYPVDHFARVDSAADVRFLLDAPAGKHGFVQSVDGHLTLDGKRFRMWGVNITGWTKDSALLPPKKESEIFASELARLGVNCVRFQFLDLPDKQQVRADVPTTYRSEERRVGKECRSR